MKDFLQTLFVGIGAAVAVVLNRLLVPTIGLTPALLVSAVSSVIVSAFLKYSFLEFPMHFRYLRRVIDPHARFEGYWIVLNAFTDQPYSYGKFLYDSRAKTYRYEGFGFNARGEILLDWRTTTLLFDSKQNEVPYFYIVRTHGENGITFSGHGVLTFWDDNGKFNSGTDTWAEDRPEGSRRSTATIRRLTTQELRKTLGHTDIRGESDVQRLIAAHINNQMTSGTGI